MSRHASGSRFQRSVLAVVIASGGATAITAQAQDQRASALEEVVVTAQRREESLQETPISITAFTEDKLVDFGVHAVADIAELAPNLAINKTPGSNTSMGMYIRGVGTSEAAPTIDPKVGLYIDGVYVSKAVGAVLDVIDLERIEVLRGPQGTLFGRNTSGGAINVTTKKPTGEFGLKANATAGNYDTQRYGLSVNLPEYAKVAAQLSVNHYETEGWADNNYDGPPITPGLKLEEDLASEDNWGYRAALRWTPRDDVTVDYTYDRTNSKGVPSPSQLTAVRDSTYNGFTYTPVPFTYIGGQLYQEMAASAEPDHRRENFMQDGATEEWTDVDGHALTAAWELSESLTVKYIWGMRYVDGGNTGSDIDGGTYYARDLFYGSLRGNNNPIQTPAFQGQTPKSQVDARTHELQFIGSLLDDRLDYTGGVFVFNEKTQQDNPQTYSLPIAFIAPRSAQLPPLYQAFGYGCPPPAPAGSLCGSQRLPFPASDIGIPGYTDFRYGHESDSWAVYGQFSYAVTDALEIMAGIRYTEDEKDAWLENESIDIDPVTVGIQQAGRLHADEQWDNISYVVNASYSITDDANVYLKYTTGYNAGGFNSRASTLSGFYTPYDEEEVEVWELGLKSEWLDNRVRLNAAVFTNDYTDIQISQFESGSGGASSKVVNAGAATYNGLELELVMVPVDGLTIDGSYGYLDAEYDEYTLLNPKTNQLENIADVTTVSYVPENTWTAGVQYDFAPFAFGALSVRMDASYRDKVVNHPFVNQYDAADDYTLLNGRISLNDIPLGCCAGNALRVSLWGKNLTDEEYRNFGIDFGSLGFAINRWGMPRTYGLDVVYEMR